MEKSVATMHQKVINHIHDDIALLILSKLPVKSLKRFRCVCKSWTLLFENTHFMSIYRNNLIARNQVDHEGTSYLLQHAMIDDHKYKTSLHFLSSERSEKMVKLDYLPSFQKDNQDVEILSSRSINGILCICIYGFNEKTLALWNPATEEFKIIPPSDIESEPYWYFGPLIHGFGYDHVQNDYKVIRRATFDELTYHDCKRLGLEFRDVPWQDISYEPVWEIYSFRNNSWSKFYFDFPLMEIPYNPYEIVRFYRDGMCHWWYKSEDHLFETSLMSFDVSNGLFITTPMPKDNDDVLDLNWIKRHLVTLINEYIVLISYRGEMTTFHISILSEIGVKESWTKFFNVGPLSCVARPIRGGKNGDIFFIKNDEELACFDLGTMMIEELGVKLSVKGQLCEMVIYKQNLLPI